MRRTGLFSLQKHCTNQHENEERDEHDLSDVEAVDWRANDERKRNRAHHRQEQVEEEDEELDDVRLQSCHDNVATHEAGLTVSRLRFDRLRFCYEQSKSYNVNSFSMKKHKNGLNCTQ